MESFCQSHHWPLITCLEAQREGVLWAECDDQATLGRDTGCNWTEVHRRPLPPPPPPPPLPPPSPPAAAAYSPIRASSGPPPPPPPHISPPPPLFGPSTQDSSLEFSCPQPTLPDQPRLKMEKCLLSTLWDEPALLDLPAGPWSLHRVRRLLPPPPAPQGPPGTLSPSRYVCTIIHLQHHKDHLEPAPPPGALRCPLRPQYDKKGGKIRWTTEFFFPENHFLFDENDF